MSHLCQFWFSKLFIESYLVAGPKNDTWSGKVSESLGYKEDLKMVLVVCPALCLVLVVGYKGNTDICIMLPLTCHQCSIHYKNSHVAAGAKQVEMSTWR